MYLLSQNCWQALSWEIRFRETTSCGGEPLGVWAIWLWFPCGREAVSFIPKILGGVPANSANWQLQTATLELVLLSFQVPKCVQIKKMLLN